MPNHFTRLRQQDLGPLAARMAEAALNAVIREWKTTTRPLADLHDSALLAAAVLGSDTRLAGGLSVSAWSEANRLAQDPTSLINTAPVPGKRS